MEIFKITNQERADCQCKMSAILSHLGESFIEIVAIGDISKMVPEIRAHNIGMYYTGMS